MRKRRDHARENIHCLDMPVVSREFGSADFERLLVLDEAAFIAFGSWSEVRKRRTGNLLGGLK